MDTLDDLDQRLCYCDTDSVMYLLKPGQNSIPTGHHLGDMTDELPQSVGISEFYCAGPKFYLLQGRESDTGETYSTFKIKGISLNQSTASSITPESIKQLIHGELEQISAPFSYISRDVRAAKIVNKTCNKSSRVTCNKRIFDLTAGDSKPFGFVPE